MADAMRQLVLEPQPESDTTTGREATARAARQRLDGHLADTRLLEIEVQALDERMDGLFRERQRLKAALHQDAANHGMSNGNQLSC
jgi:hypothetical protein